MTKTLLLLVIGSSATARAATCYTAEVIPAVDKANDQTSWFAIDDSGDMAGNYCADADCPSWDSNVRGAVYDASTGHVTTFSAPDGFNVVQTDSLNDAGLIVGTAVAGNGSGGIGKVAAFTWSNGQSHLLPDPVGAGYYAATDVNASGTIIGYSACPDGSCQRVGWALDKDGDVTEVRVEGAARTLPFAIDASGDIAGTFLDGTWGYYGAFFLPKGGDMQILTPPDQFFIDFTEVYVQGMDNRGTLVGQYIDYLHSEEGAFVWPERGDMQRLNVLGYTDTVLTGIDESGRMSGSAAGGTVGLLVSPTACDAATPP